MTHSLAAILFETVWLENGWSMAMDFSTIDARITQVNQRLKAARLGLVVERRGEKLALRGTLPLAR
ncbi:MAG: hypothetical protein HC881_17320 [Leptolyngbyaceae cyanobacterium SL_7_1]|nr:hypothetical protein [Leptolyngbyaceae cyanobacterium SL_7_1]